MSFPLVQLMAAPSVDADVLYDFNVDRDSGVGHDGLSFGAPEWSGEPGTVGGRDGYRTVEFVHLVESSAREAVSELTTLTRLLTAADGWLLVRLTAFTEPRWFRTYRSDASGLSWENILLHNDGPRGLFEIPVKLTAEPWLYGEKVTHDLGVIALDPAVGCFKLLPEVVGDAPAPATLRMQWSTGRSAFRDMTVTGPIPVDQTAALVWQIGTGDGWTAGDDTSAPVADSAFSAGSYRSVSFATQSALASRLTRTLTVKPGRYKVMLRASRSDTDSTFAFRFGSSVEFVYRYGDRVPAEWWPRAQHAAWVDLGDFSLPMGVPPVDLDNEAAVNFDAQVQVERISGAGSCRLDALMLIPVSEEARVLKRDCGTLGIGDWWYFTEIQDAEAEAVYVRWSASGVLSSSFPPALMGGFGQVVPGKPNGLHVLGQSHPVWSNWLGVPASDSIAESVAVTLDYYPRHMWPDPGA